MKIGILQTGHAPEPIRSMHGDYDQWFRRFLGGRGFEFESWYVEDMQLPPGADAADGWLITGSRHGAYEDHSWIPLLEDLIREIHARKVPLVGICFGHQIIAQALGGRVEKFAGGWSIGKQSYKMGTQAIALNAWHQDQVVARPETATHVAGSAFCENAILAYGDHILTVQAHPEFDEPFVEDMITHRGQGNVPDDLLATASARTGTPNDNMLMAEMLAATLMRKIPA